MNKLWLGLIVVILIIGAAMVMGNRNDDGAAGSIVIKGSDTEVQLVANLAESFRETHDKADVAVTGGGSGVGIAAVIAGEIDIANSSRKMKDDELKQASDRGYSIQEFVLARDGLSVIVHPTNPVKELSVDQIGKIFRGEIKNWKEFGGPNQPITLYGRQSTSGTYTFFRDAVVKADYAATMRNMEGSQAIVDAVISDTTGIGYVGVGYIKTGNEARTDLGIVSVKSTGAAISPLNKESVLAGDYPIVRPIYQYLKELPAKDSVIEQFLRFEMSEPGIAIIEATGFYPLTEADRAQNDALLAKISG